MITLNFPDIVLDTSFIAEQLHIDAASVSRLVKLVLPVVDSKVAFRVCYLDLQGEDFITIESIRFSSIVLAKNLRLVGKVFPFVLTLGDNYDALMDDTKDMLDKYFLDQIGNIVLMLSRQKFEKYLIDRFAFNTISYMSPGSLEDWPITEQKKLFELLNGVESTISVRLTDSCLMLPRKSISGIYFPSETTFLTCQLCPREYCKSRKASFNESKAREYGIRLDYQQEKGKNPR
jgi:hypothetical protein